VSHHRTQVGTTDADIDHVADTFARADGQEACPHDRLCPRVSHHEDSHRATHSSRGRSW
jgi:hypothetical protein